MERWSGRVVLVTGASSGIGAEICKELVKYGMKVVGCARNVDKIREIAAEESVKKASGHLLPIKCDLTNEAEILDMFQEIREQYGRLDVCINNAGFSTKRSLSDGETHEWRSMLDVNVLALCICNRESIKLMKEKNIDDGQIINISSMSGHRLASSMAAFYAGTKFMVRALTEGLRREVTEAGTHIRIASISPGVVETDFFFRMNEDKEKTEAFYQSMKCLQAKDIADSVVYILQS
ncbi:Dehydrogenase/reductase SDR family member 11, partial [Stegodyphus mimosarum]